MLSNRQDLRFGEKTVNKREFHMSRKFIDINEVDTGRIVVSKKHPFGKNCVKYFVGYCAVDDSPKPLLIKLPKMTGYLKCFAGIEGVESKNMSFIIESEELLSKYNSIWNKVSELLAKEFGSEPVFNEKYLKTKIKAHKGEIKTDFHGDTPPEGKPCVARSIILIDSVCKSGKSFYPQTFLEECVYKVRKEIRDRFLDDDDDDDESFNNISCRNNE